MLVPVMPAPAGDAESWLGKGLRGPPVVLARSALPCSGCSSGTTMVWDGVQSFVVYVSPFTVTEMFVLVQVR